MKKLFTTLVLLFFIATSMLAQKLPFQGYLEESGVPVEGTRDFTFNLPAYGWIETFSAVPVTNGVYNVVLGSNTPLPKNIFGGVSEISMNVGVNSTPIGSITLYKPLVSANTLLDAERDMTIIGPNDSTNLKMGSNNLYYGSVNFYDSLGVQQGFLSADPAGGRLQLNQRDGGGNFSSAVVMRTNNTSSTAQFWGQNTTADGITLMIENYITGNQIDLGPQMSGNYRRSGTDWKDNAGNLLAAIGNTRDEGGSDPTGHSGYLSLWGTNSFNAQLTGKRWINNDLPILELFGINDNGSGFWLSNVIAEVNPGTGTDNYGSLLMRNTDNGNISTDGLFLTSNLNATSGGGIEVKDNTSANRIILEGQTGLISSERPSGGSAVRLFQNSGNGGISIENAAQDVNFNYEAEINILDMSNAGAPTITIDGSIGDITAIGQIDADILSSTSGTVIASDRRYKKEINTLENALDNTLKMRGTSYFWKDEKKTQKRQIGVIAQEVEKIYPEFVHTNKDGYKAVNYAQMTAVLIEAVKELNAKIENLEADNKELTTALNEQQKLNDRITKLEKLLLENAKLATNE
ncbi:tail fiber domain-containing protein [Marivirga arenosa]|uniref:Tail fiber domain-containing protein n=1 Tax=Marivirga arenosa TaxID=3059076 RepID=A0AA51RCV4_9BACT|nr:tail fiber domain-containing protein [Marivirga sp. ABR2-2]WMN06230.1 tail fiber domain-containing protein [Marivirga sp. ABR2-2]